MYKITKRGDTLSVVASEKDGCFEKKVYCSVWTSLPEDRVYTVYLSWANSEGDALDIGKKLIDEYIRVYSDPMVTIKEVVDGKKTGACYEEIFHVICQKLIEMEKRD